MAKSGVLCLAFVLVFVGQVMCAPADTGKVERRDTDQDQVAPLKAKLQRLHELLMELYADDEPKGKDSDSAKQKEATPISPVVRSEDMASEGDKETSDGSEEELGSLNKKKQEASSGSSKEEEVETLNEESAQVLAKALARLRAPVYTGGSDNTGDYLGSQYDERPVASKVRGMEDVLKRALTRLSTERRDGTLEEGYRPRNIVADERTIGQLVDRYERTNRGGFQDTNADAFHDGALRAVELKLMRDIQAARQLGVSVEEIIDDLQGKAYQEAELKEMERELMSRRHYV